MGGPIEWGRMRGIEPEQIPREDSFPEEGRYQGQTARTAPDAMSLIADASEELTFSMAEIMEKKTAKRKMGEESQIDPRLMDKIRQLQEMVPDLGNPKEIQQFVQQLKQMENATPQEILRLVRQFSGDPTHQYCALECAREMLEGDEETKELVARALEELNAQEGPSIRAGFNISREAETFSKQGLGDLQQLRDLYRAHVLGFDNILSAYEAIDARFGMAHFDKTIDFLLRAIGADIEAKQPSTPLPELKQVHDDLFQVRTLGRIHDGMEKLTVLMKRQFGVTLRNAPRELMRQLFSLLKMPYVSETHFTGVVDQNGVRAPEARINFMREWNNQVRELPLKVFDDSDKRGKLQLAGQQALDVLIEQEEEAW